MYLLDTNHCTRILNGDTVLGNRAETAQGGVAINAVIQGELEFMVARSDQRAGNASQLTAFVDDVGLFAIDEGTARVYGDLKAAIFRHFGPRERARLRNTQLRHLGFSDNDLWIAATALQHDLTLVSADSDFTRMKEVCAVKVETWWNPPAPPS